MGGNILVIGGGPYQGAPYLAGLAALRAGADIVRIVTPHYLPEPDLIHIPTAGDEAGFRKLKVNLTCDPVFSSKRLFVSE